MFEKTFLRILMNGSPLSKCQWGIELEIVKLTHTLRQRIQNLSSHLSFAIEMTKVACNFDRPRGKRKSNGDQSKERPVAKKRNILSVKLYRHVWEKHFLRLSNALEGTNLLFLFTFLVVLYPTSGKEYTKCFVNTI